jgi:hypothetical protein
MSQASDLLFIIEQTVGDLGDVPRPAMGIVKVNKAGEGEGKALRCPHCNKTVSVVHEASEGKEETAKKMVANIEKKRKAGKYSPEEKAKLVKKFMKFVKEDEEQPHLCVGCGATYVMEAQICPECGTATELSEKAR